MAAATAVLGAEAMAAMSTVAARVNATIYRQTDDGAAVRLAGRLVCADAGTFTLTATDGGSVGIRGLSADAEAMMNAFVEVVGSKAGDGSLQATGIVPLGDGVDVQLWDESVRLMHTAQLLQVFQPVAVAA
eukprot:TRINITY_DN18051_c0_g1_i2.p1 TRINITY_DN18051_c0_g1~~TRINITY_DN18051_c0_g1_i2.p1  ORF type:complete len:131 (-),score=33.01 TRINITY_DN18051_c0_g1_i2:120-512(-)